MNQENISSYIMQQQAVQQRFQNAQHPLQSQPAQQQAQRTRASPGMKQAALQGGSIANGDMSGDGVSSPNLGQGSNHHHSNSNPSFHTQQALAAASGQSFQGVNGGRTPQALSNGQVPQLVQHEHDLMRQNPGMSQSEARQIATDKLKHVALMRQNAMNSASGMTSPGQGQQSQNAHAMQGGGSQSPYQQHSVPVPQMQSPYQQNGVLGSNHLPQHNNSNNLTQQQQAYQNAMRNKMYSQHMHQMQPQQAGSGMGASSSPQMGHPATGFQNSNSRQMRPPSRSASGFEIPQYPGHDMQRPGSAAAQSPRPISAQGYGPQS